VLEKSSDWKGEGRIWGKEAANITGTREEPRRSANSKGYINVT
jgi:hypothetical protein